VTPGLTSSGDRPATATTEWRSAFAGLDIAEVPAETTIAGDVDDDGDVQKILTVIQSLGLHLISVRRAPGGQAVHRLD
jgi:hypothetical protein